MSDDYFKGLCDVQLQTMERQNAEIHRLRKEVATLKKALADQQTLTDSLRQSLKAIRRNTTWT